MKISLSILDFDFSNLASELSPLYPYIDYLHMDVMDGVFVPNISFGLPIIKSLRNKTDILFDTHLMINDPYKYAKQFVEAGSNMLTFHYEAASDVSKTISLIKSLGAKVGLSLKPGTDVNKIIPYLKDLDLVLVMSVEPGFGGQKFMTTILDKLSLLYLLKGKYHYQIAVDGGINLDSIDCVKACADIVILGSVVAKSKDRISLLKTIKEK